jgi:hypothetical protein
VKLGTENKKKTYTAIGLGVVAVILLIRAFTGGGSDTPAPAPAPTAGTTAARTTPKSKPAHTYLVHSLDPSLRFDLLKSSEDVTYKGSGRDIFRSQPEVSEIPKPVTPDVQPNNTPPPPPPPPPIDLKFYGYTGPKNGNKRIFLLKGEDIFLAREGDIVDRRYKIMHIGPNSVEVQDVLTNNTQTLPFTG